jgi:hypothetical protein
MCNYGATPNTNNKFRILKLKSSEPLKNVVLSLADSQWNFFFYLPPHLVPGLSCQPFETIESFTW